MDELDELKRELSEALDAYMEAFSWSAFYGSEPQRAALKLAQRRGRQDIIDRIMGHAPKRP